MTLLDGWEGWAGEFIRVRFEGLHVSLHAKGVAIKYVLHDECCTTNAAR